MGVIKDHRDEKINGTWSLVNICGRGMSDDSSEMKLWITYQFKKDLCSPVLFLKVTRIGSGDRLEFNAELKQLKAAASETRDSEYNTLGKAMMFCARFLQLVVKRSLSKQTSICQRNTNSFPILGITPISKNKLGKRLNRGKLRHQIAKTVPGHRPRVSQNCLKPLNHQ